MAVSEIRQYELPIEDELTSQRQFDAVRGYLYAPAHPAHAGNDDAEHWQYNAYPNRFGETQVLQKLQEMIKQGNFSAALNLIIAAGPVISSPQGHDQVQKYINQSLPHVSSSSPEYAAQLSGLGYDVRPDKDKPKISGDFQTASLFNLETPSQFIQVTPSRETNPYARLADEARAYARIQRNVAETHSANNKGPSVLPPPPPQERALHDALDQAARGTGDGNVREVIYVQPGTNIKPQPINLEPDASQQALLSQPVDPKDQSARPAPTPGL